MRLTNYLTTMLGTSLLCLFLVGCDDTARGAKEDASELGQQAEQATQRAEESLEDAAARAEEGAEEAAKDIEEASENLSVAGLTPSIKSAILANPILNEEGNEINVDSTDEGVMLRGHVMTAEQKELAGDIAAKILSEKESDLPLMNELEVKELTPSLNYISKRELKYQLSLFHVF